MIRADDAEDAAAFRPSEYTAALLRALLADPSRVRGARVLDVGCGCGALLAAAGRIGAGALCGVDIEPAAARATASLLAALGLGANAETHHGDQFAPVGGRKFDLVLANLPHFPVTGAQGAGTRLPSWSAGGANGRANLDRFLAEVPAHLAPNGAALIVHNMFVGLDETRAAAAKGGLAVEILGSILVPIAPEKLAIMTPAVREQALGRSLLVYGPHAFGEVATLTLRHRPPEAG